MPPKKVLKSTPAKKRPAPKLPRESSLLLRKAGGEKSSLLPGKPPAAERIPRKAPPPAPPKLKKPPVAAPAEALTEDAPERYWEAVGRRKTAVARVRLFTKGEKGVWVNGKPLADYLAYPHLRQRADEALELMKTADRFRATVRVKGGGLMAQAEAIRHGTARALVLFNPDFRKRLKRAGFLRRDPRMKERKKFGLKGARRAPQWAKR